jgi:two-component system, sporulation sensor kinase E
MPSWQNGKTGWLWLRAINSVVESGGQAYFETYEAVNDKYLDVMVFNPVSGPMIALVSDVSQVKRIEERFQKQIVFLENILDGIPTPVFYRDTCGRFQFANKAFAIAIGLDRRDILGQSLFKVLPEDLASKYRAMDLDLLTNAGIQTYEWEFQHANGNRYDVIFNKAPLSNSEEEFIGVVGTFIDITQRKEAQEALRLSEEKFRGIFRQSPIGIAVYNPKGQLIDVNMAMTNILGIDSIEDVRHFNLFADRHFKHGDEHILNKMAILSYEEELDFDKIRSVNAYKTNKTGKSFIKYFISPLRYPDGSIEGFLVQIQDITEQKIAAEALQASEANLRRLTDNMIDMIGQVNIAGDYEYITPSCHSMLGYEVEEMLGRSFYEFVHAQDLDKVKEHFTSAFRSKTFSKFDYRYLCKDGSYIYVETVVNIIFDKKGRIYGAVLVSRDISDRKRMESELSRLDRLKTVGEMAAGLGHEIRNPMTTVRGFLQMLGDNPEFQDYQEVFSLMIEELDDANSIITEFLSLAKDKPLYSEQGNLNDILMAIYPLISADAIKSDKEVKMELKNIPDLMLDSKEIRQLIFNMTRNGLESMQPGQVLTIKTYQKDDMVVLQIQDQGCGIQDEILENLGTPFYTTKDMGVGLGLPICFNIAARHNARIDVNTSSQGTTFWINFRL